METPSAKSDSTFFWAIGVALVAIIIFIIFSSKSNQTASSTSTIMGNDDSHHTADSTSGNPQDGEVFLNMIGKPAPAFSFRNMGGRVYSSDSLKGRNVVLFFNEGLMCYPACWNQMASFAKDARFKQNDTEIISVVTDPAEEWQKAVAKMPDLAAATVMFDTDTKYSKSFGVLDLPSSMHKGALPGHTYIVIDKQGMVKMAFDDPAMAVNNDRLIQILSQ